MEQTPFRRDLDRAYTKIRMCELAYADVAYAYEQGRTADAYRNAFDLAHQAERLVLIARSLPALTGSPSARREMDAVIMDAMPITVGATSEGWFGVDIPALLPKKERGGADYIRQSLYLALEAYFKERDRLRIDDCVLSVCHRYNRERPERACRDHDNIELNAVVDALAMFALHDDAPLRCSHFYCSVMDIRDATTVLLVPKASFPLYWERLQTKPETLLPELTKRAKNA